MMIPRCPNVPQPKWVSIARVIRIALNCWKYRLYKACHDVLDGGVLHLDVLGGPECLFVLLTRKRFWTGRAIALGSTVLVMSNELHLS
jgi:hypothetical protein